MQQYDNQGFLKITLLQFERKNNNSQKIQLLIKIDSTTYEYQLGNFNNQDTIIMNKIITYLVKNNPKAIVCNAKSQDFQAISDFQLQGFVNSPNIRNKVEVQLVKRKGQQFEYPIIYMGSLTLEILYLNNTRGRLVIKNIKFQNQNLAQTLGLEYNLILQIGQNFQSKSLTQNIKQNIISFQEERELKIGSLTQVLKIQLLTQKHETDDSVVLQLFKEGMLNFSNIFQIFQHQDDKFRLTFDYQFKLPIKKQK